MAEIYLDVTGYEGIYQVSNLGNIKSLHRYIKHCKGGLSIFKERILKQSINGKGYLNIDLSINGITQKSVDVHRIVAKAFIYNNDNKPCVNHINGIKTDNRVENLEWCTYNENTVHAFKIGLMKNDVGEKSRNVKLTNSEVLAIRASSLTNKDLSKIYTIHSTMISRIRNRKNWKHI